VGGLSTGAVVVTEERLRGICLAAQMTQAQTDTAMAGINAAETKGALKAMVAEAVGKGAFGAPFMVVAQPGKAEQIFFGSDRFEQMAWSCGLPYHGPDPSRPTLLAAKL
jgi:2-hydroxychromene-2-carboxylate isomerase